MKILRIIVPKGEKPKSCLKCDCEYCKLYVFMKRKERKEGIHKDCPIEEEKPKPFCENVTGCGKWENDECFPETCDNFKQKE